MKKNLLFLPLVFAVLALGSCSKYDDSALSGRMAGVEGRMAGVEGRVSALEEQVKAMNSDIVAIRTLVTALQSNDYVTKVERITEGDRSGYRISFTKSSPITIYHGTNGTNGRDGANGAPGRDGVSPVIGVRQEGGIYYWTLNGAWLTDAQGQKVKAQGPDGTPGRDGVTPQLKIENEYWHVSHDNGQTWQSLNVRAHGEQGVAGTNAFQAVRVEGTNVIFTLADGAQTLTLPLYQEMSLRFTNTEDYAVFPNQTYEIPYATTGITSDVQIKVIGQDGVRAKLFRHDTNGGVIKVTMPSTVVDTEVIVFLADGRGYTRMYALALYQGILMPSSDSYLADKSGATLEVPVRANSQYTVEIPSEASSWISYETLRALTIRDERLRFTVQKNPQSTLRSAVVKLKVNGVVTKTITIAQKGASNTYAVTPGGLEAQLGGNLPYELKLSSGTLSVADFTFLSRNSDKIKILDLSGLSMTELPRGAFSSSRFEEVKLPNGLRVIPEKCFYQSRIQRISIPQSVTSIEDDAFFECTGLTGSLTIPQSVMSIGQSAFFECTGLTGSLVIPQSVTSIGRYAFSGCSGFTGTLVIPQSVTSIGDYAFHNCTGLTGTLVIPQSVEGIGNGAFSGCSGFTGTLVIPQSVEGIGNGAFYGCTGFTGSLVIPQSVKVIGNGAFSGCTGLTGTLVIPQGVTHIGDGAFSDCTGFTGSLVIPQSVTSIGRYAFSGCSGFEGDLIIEGAPSVGEMAFWKGTRERLNFRAVYSKAAAPERLYSYDGAYPFWAGSAYGAKPPVLYIPRGTRAQYEQAGWTSQFERVEETDTWPQVNQ